MLLTAAKKKYCKNHQPTEDDICLLIGNAVEAVWRRRAACRRLFKAVCGLAAELISNVE